MNLESEKDILLSMVGVVILEKGYWYEIDASAVEESVSKPHGLSYALTLHEPNGKCLYRLDNAHGIKVGKSPGRRKRMEYDHEHPDGRKKHVVYYEYSTALDLMKDFFDAIDQILIAKGIRI
jgi:hypothetical protein